MRHSNDASDCPEVKVAVFFLPGKGRHLLLVQPAGDGCQDRPLPRLQLRVRKHRQERRHGLSNAGEQALDFQQPAE